MRYQDSMHKSNQRMRVSLSLIAKSQGLKTKSRIRTHQINQTHKI